MNKKMLISLILILIMIMFSEQAFTQCPMCKMSAESNLAAGGTEGRGLNGGILYLLALPYLMVGTLAFIWYKRRSTKE